MRRLLGTALDLPASQRDTWLERLDARYAEFAPRLRALLAHAASPAADSVLGTLPKIETGQFAPRPPASASDAAAGESIGPYRLLREIGSGGMASVWLAERTDMLKERKVALKLPHGAWRRAGLAERMQREREILATLNHPNIARLYDAGVAGDGQPYLALEYVEGERIDAWCKRKGLDVRARLRLFQQVARAVAHAHANLVVHRDLKPGNILVTEAGEVRLLDFGIAKLLEQGIAEETELTQQSGRALTPDYAAPEQILGRPIGTAADIYALGVVLFELLTGARPYALKRDSRAALEEAVLQAEPARPSATVSDPKLRKALRGDLDTIVAKALKKDPQQRYATVDALAEDIERHLDSRPVLAQPDSSAYRLRKFVARNRLAVGATAAVLGAILSGAGLAVWQASVALAEQRRAEEVKNFITSMFRDADPFSAANSKPTVEDLLRQAQARLAGRFAAQPALRVELLEMLGSSLIGISQFEAAESALRQALDEGIPALGARHLMVLRARAGMTSVHRFRGRQQQMQIELDAVLADMRATPGLPVADLLVAVENSAHLAIDRGRYADAQAAAREAAALAKQHLGARDPGRVSAALLLAVAYSYDRDHERTLAASRDALRMARDVFGADKPHVRVLEARAMYGRALGDFGRYDEAAQEMAAVLRDTEQLLGPNSTMVGFFAADVARFQLEVGDVRGSLANSERSLGLVSSLAQADSYTVAMAQLHVGRAQLAMRRPAEALQTLARARSAMREARGPASPLALDLSAHVALALALAGRLDEAQAEIDAGIERLRSASGQFKFRAMHSAGTIRRLARDWPAALKLQQDALAALDDAPMHARRRAMARTEIALSALEQGDPHLALETLQPDAVPAAEQAPPSMPADADRLLALGRAELALDRAAQAEPALSAADAFWRDFEPDSRWAGEAAFWLGRCHAALGRPAPAREAFARAAKILERSPFPADAGLVERAR